jgi:hypothetical protein
MRQLFLIRWTFILPLPTTFLRKTQPSETIIKVICIHEQKKVDWNFHFRFQYFFFLTPKIDSTILRLFLDSHDYVSINFRCRWHGRIKKEKFHWREEKRKKFSRKTRRRQSESNEFEAKTKRNNWKENLSSSKKF